MLIEAIEIGTVLKMLNSSLCMLWDTVRMEIGERESQRDRGTEREREREREREGGTAGVCWRQESSQLSADPSCHSVFRDTEDHGIDVDSIHPSWHLQVSIFGENSFTFPSLGPRVLKNATSVRRLLAVVKG